MELLDLLDALDAHAVTLQLDGNRMRATGPRSAIDLLADDLRLHRDLLHAPLPHLRPRCPAPTHLAGAV